MQYIYAVFYLLWKCISAMNVPIYVPIEVNTVGRFGNDRIDNPYHLKLDYKNYDKDIVTLIRRSGIYPLVEVGPGSFKAEHKRMQPEYLANQYKKLLALKKKMDKHKN